jgi:excisionase family DNA binding protein
MRVHRRLLAMVGSCAIAGMKGSRAPEATKTDDGQARARMRRIRFRSGTLSVAQLFGVRTTTIARRARAGRLQATLTPGGHRRYRRADVQELLNDDDLDDLTPERSQLEADAVRLYERGWSAT